MTDRLAALSPRHERRSATTPDRYLSGREYDVAGLVAAGLKDVVIGRQLGLSPSTVATYVQRIQMRLGVSGRRQIAAWVTARTAQATRSPSPEMSRPPDPSVRRLTPREREVAHLITDGVTNAVIALRLGLTRSTVGTCVQRVQRRLDLSGRAEIATWVEARRTPGEPEARLRRVGAR
jgi:DNA-binding NarL/FixJ family response regulator